MLPQVTVSAVLSAARHFEFASMTWTSSISFGIHEHTHGEASKRECKHHFVEFRTLRMLKEDYALTMPWRETSRKKLRACATLTDLRHQKQTEKEPMIKGNVGEFDYGLVHKPIQILEALKICGEQRVRQVEKPACFGRKES